MNTTTNTTGANINTEALNDRPAGDDATLADDGRTIEGGITVVEEKLDHALVVTNPAQYAKILFEPFFAELTSARRKAAAAKYDITTPAGMEAAKMHAKTFTKIRTNADKVKVEAKKPIDQSGKIILSEFDRLATAAKAEQAKHEKAIADEQARLEKIEEEKRQAERARIEAIETRLSYIRGLPRQLEKADAAFLQARLDELLAKQLDPALYEEFLEQAAEAMIETTDAVRQLLKDAIEREAAAARLAELEAAEAARKAAADAMAAQQQLMLDILGIQNLASELVANGFDKDRTYVEAALAKVAAFDPAACGAMAPMATLARDSVLPSLQNMLGELAFVEAAEETTTLLEQQAAVAASVAASEAPAATPAPSGAYRFPARAIPEPKRPTDIAIVDVLAAHYGVPALVAVGWLETVDAAQLRDALKAA